MGIAIVLCVVVIALVLFSFERIPMEVSALVIVCLLAVTRVLPPGEAFAGFSNETVIFIFTLLSMTQALSSAGVVQLIGQRLSFFGKFGHQVFVLAMMVLVAAFSSVVSNTVTTAAFLPVAIGAATRARVPKSKVLMPLAYASMLGGTIFLYGTSTNLVVSEAMVQFGLGPIEVTELAPIGIPIALLGIAVVVLLGPWLLPAREGREPGEYGLRDYLTEVVLSSPLYAGKQLAELTKGLGFRVLGLVRDGKVLAAEPSAVLQGNDRILIEGSRDDMLRVKDLRGIEIRPEVGLAPQDLAHQDTELVEAQVHPGSPLVGRSLREALFSERYGLVALAIHRRPAIRRVTKLQLLGRLWGETSLATLSLAVGDVLLLRGPRSRVRELADGSTLTIVGGVEYQPPRYTKAALAVAIFAAVLLAATLHLAPLSVLGLTGMLLMILTGCVDARRAFRVDWRVVLLIAAMLALGVAMEKSGAGAWVAQHLEPLDRHLGPRGVLVVLMVVTVILSAPMSNQAAALVMLPVAVATARTLGVEVRPFAIGICLAASCSFITPLEPSCVLVYGPGHYKFTDFFRLGTPLTIALLAVLAYGVPAIWPFGGAR